MAQSMINRNSRVGVILSYGVALLPVALWLGFGGASVSFSSIQATLDSLAKMLGLIGASLFAWNLILSARISWLEKQFGGLDRLYKTHHMIGGFAFMAMLAHPLLLTIKFASISLKAAYEFSVPSLSDPGLIAGRLVLEGMTVILFITFYIYLSHERFLWVHRLSGLLFIVAVYHFLFVNQSDVRSIFPLLVYLTILSGAAVGLYGYRTLFGQSLKPRFKYKVQSINRLGDAVEVVLKSGKRAMQFSPGQFSFLTFVGTDVPQQTHPFSISSGDNDTTLRYTIKNLGDFTAQLKALKPGDSTFVEGPYGSFSYRNMGCTKQIWVAGGIGITPFLSMARSLKPKEDYQIHLYYSVADMGQAYFADELARIADASQGRLTFSLHDSSKSGYLTSTIITKGIGDMTEYDVLLCGPKGMMGALSSQFRASGVEKTHIQYEEFALL